ncbi:MAG: tRNA (adenosine(37)-N6)-dimethylallyltransferase MiaA [Actinomycetota bacterium]|nr:tRNA (adenosine(37)-N6)-dimethylallyltransferase MiaA [Actinomycetota bacterium]
MAQREANREAPRILALVGPTATGKSALAVELARHKLQERSVEILAADAFTVYRGMDVGTAKPSADTRAAVPHHLVDVLEPWRDATVAWFQKAARAAIEDILARGRLPLLVGGSGLYFRALVDGLRFPPTDPAVRAALETRHLNDPAAAHAALAAVDPLAAAKIEPANVRRVVRALEVMELTGQKFSSFAKVWDRHESIYPGLEVRGLDLPTTQLRSAIADRSAEMVAAGLLEEAASLRRQPRPLSRTAAQAIGYAEAFAVLDGKLELADLASAITDRTWRYARRQRSWFRSDPRVQWSSPDEVRSAWT